MRLLAPFVENNVGNFCDTNTDDTRNDVVLNRQCFKYIVMLATEYRFKKKRPKLDRTIAPLQVWRVSSVFTTFLTMSLLLWTRVFFNSGRLAGQVCGLKSERVDSKFEIVGSKILAGAL